MVDITKHAMRVAKRYRKALLRNAKLHLRTHAPVDTGKLKKSFHIDRGAGLLTNDCGYMNYLTNLRDGRHAQDWIDDALRAAKKQTDKGYTDG